MDNILNSKIDKQTIYEIYRACRLCGAGAGYKMPIIQNVVDIDCCGIELKQKIRDCVQIEVSPDDKMPPLICELCVDKVNDFYEFMDMCQQTNKRTRQRLGLPQQTLGNVRTKDCQETSDCILGVTETVFRNDDVDEPAIASKKQKVDPKVKIKVEKEAPPRSRRGRSPTPPRATRRKAPSPAPVRTTRQARTSIEDNVSLSNLKQQSKKAPVKSPPPPKSILKKEVRELQIDQNETSKLKRLRDPPKVEVPQKKVKLSLPPPAHRCAICRMTTKSPQALTSHMKSHTVGFTSEKLSCNACREWYPTPEEAAVHHRGHAKRPYRCVRCRNKYTQRTQFDRHVANGQCVTTEEVPDVKCDACWKTFPTRGLMQAHRCGGEDARPGGKCQKCKRTYTLLKNLMKHEETCTAKKKSDVIVDPEVQKRITPVKVRIVKCDSLLPPGGRSCNVSHVSQKYGLDPNAVYPYMRVKSELDVDSMVKIQADLEDCLDYVHWDSDVDPEDQTNDGVETLTALCMKTIFSEKLLGKVPRRRRLVKVKAFDSIDYDDDIKRDINNIIDNLNISIDDDGCSVNSESLLVADVSDNLMNRERSSGVNDGLVGVNDSSYDGINNDLVDKSDSNEARNDDLVQANDSNKAKDDDLVQANDSNKAGINDDLVDDNDSNKGGFNDLAANYSIQDDDLVKNNDTVINDDLVKANDSDKTKDDDHSKVNKDNEKSDIDTSNKDTNQTKDDTENSQLTEINDDDARTECNDSNTDCHNDKIDSNEKSNNDTQAENKEESDDLVKTYHINDVDQSLMEAIDEQIGEVNDDKSCLKEVPLENDAERENHDDKVIFKEINDGINDLDAYSLKNNDRLLGNNHSQSGGLAESHSSQSNDKFVENNDNHSSLRLTKGNNTQDIDRLDKNCDSHNDRSADKNCFQNNDSFEKKNDFSNNDKFQSNDRFDNDSQSHVSLTKNNEAQINERLKDNCNPHINDRENNSQTDIFETNGSVTNDRHSENKDSLNNERDNVTRNNDNDQANIDALTNDKDKITLEDLLPPEDSGRKSMDLDSISDEEFNFDA